MNLVFKSTLTSVFVVSAFKRAAALVETRWCHFILWLLCFPAGTVVFLQKRDVVVVGWLYIVHPKYHHLMMLHTAKTNPQWRRKVPKRFLKLFQIQAQFGHPSAQRGQDHRSQHGFPQESSEAQSCSELRRFSIW